MRRASLFAIALFLILTLGSSTGLAQETPTPTPEPPPIPLEPSGDGFRVVEVLPADGTAETPVDAVLTVIFNRPVVPLGIVEEADNLPDPISIRPAIDGEGEWLNTAIYVFRPDPAWAGGLTYTVTVDASLTAADGSVLVEPPSWSFTTVTPEVIGIIPEDASNGVRRDPRIQITFNQPVDQASVEESFFLRPAAETDGTVSGGFEWSEDGTGVSFEPDDLLPYDTQFVAGFPPDSVFDPTGQVTLPGTRWTFVTQPLPAIVGTTPFDSQTDAPVYGALEIFFAAPMDVDTLEDRVIIDPQPWRDPEFYYQEYNNSLVVSFPVEPSTDYTITIEAGMADLYGTTIDEPVTVSYTTQPYGAEFSLRVPGPVGFYNAYREPTTLFLTHRNVDYVDLSLYNIPLSTFASRATGDNYYDPAYNFVPPPDTLMRSWRVDSEAPLNALRYDMLEMQPGDPTLSCSGSLPSRIQLGDTAVVISDPDPLRARSAPVDGEIIDLLYRDYQLPIIGGPTCAGDLLWWEVELADGRTAWVAESAEEEYYLEVPNPVQQQPVEVSFEEGEALPPGVYLLSATAPAEVADIIQRHFMIVATANLVMKMSVDSATVWATDVQTGEPLADMPITLYGRGYNEVASGTTDADGIARFDFDRVSDLYTGMIAVLQTDEHFGLGLNHWSEGIDPWRFNQESTFYPQRYRVYIYTDRPLYRPGQPVYFRGAVRLQDDVTYTLPDRENVPVQIYDEEGEIIFEEEVALTEFGTFSGEIELADDSGLGYYRIEVRLSPPNQNYEGGSISFGVAEYRLPEFQVEMEPVVPGVVQGDTVTVSLDSTYFFGGAVSNAEVEYNVVANPYSFPYTGPAGRFDFVDYDYDGGPSEFYSFSGGVIASGTGVTDAQGMLTIEVPADLEDATQSFTFTVEAVVTDESQQAVAGRAEVVVHQGLVYVGVRPDQYVGIAGEESAFSLITVDWDSNPVADQSVSVEVVERRWSSVQEQDPDTGRTTWTWEVEEIPVDEGEVTTDENGRAQFTFTPPNGGVFKAIVTTRDAEGNAVRSSSTMWVSGNEYISWRQQNSNRIDLIADKNDYAIGETAQILVTSPFQGTTEALITVERGDVLMVDRVTMESNSLVYELPITDDFAPNVYVSVMLVKGVDENNPVAGFRMGLIQLAVDTGQKELNIEITPDTEQAGPRDTVTYTVRTTDFEGNPVRAEVGVGLTDLASLSIAEPNSTPILRYFYGQQGLSVRTATLLTLNTDQLTQTVLDTIKGGGGGFGEGGIFDIREDFVDTAFWNPTLVTNADGEATFSVTLPDNLTTWRLDARAVTTGADGVMLVGQDTFDLLSTKPLLIRPVTPRFFVVGDEVVLAAVVNNNTDESMAVEVSLTGTGVTFDGDATQTVTIIAGGRARVEWPVTVDNVESVDLTFAVVSPDGDLSDASKPPLGQGDERVLPVYRFESPETVGTGGVLRGEDTRTESIALPETFEVVQADLTVNVDYSLAAASLNSLRALRNYSFNSTEAIISRFLPNIMTLRALSELDVDMQALRDQLNREVAVGVQRLYALQHVDGGWGWYVRDRSDPVVTAYAIIALQTALDEGFAVSESVISSAQQYLSRQYITPGLSQPTWRLNRQAFILYAMAYSGSPDVARTATLFDNRERLGLWAKAMLADTIHIINPNDEARLNVLASELVSAAVLSANGAHWEEEQRDYWNWNTDTRTTALILRTLLRLNPENELIPNVVRWLMVARTADAWETTQETAWAVMALTDYMVATGELRPDYDYSVAFNDSPLTDGDAAPGTVLESEELVIDIAQMLLDEVNTLTFTRGEGPGALYYTAYLRVFLPVPEIEPLNQGVIVQRRYVLLDDPDGASITSAPVGELVQVRLTIIAPNDLYYLVIEDPIPAGTDAVNPELDTSQQIGTRPGLTEVDPVGRGWGWWWFSDIDFRDEQVVLSSTYLPAGTYEFVYTIRPGLPGVFNVMPPIGYETYFPEVYGRGAGSTFTITPAE